MSATMNKPCTPTHQTGLSSPCPPETHQRAGGFVIERLEGIGVAARLTANPGKGAWIHKVGAGGYLLLESTGYRFSLPEVWVNTHHAAAAKVLAAIEAIELGNNGYADIGNDEVLANAVELAGYTVIHTTDLHGRPVYRGFTARGQEALRGQLYGVSTYATPGQNLNSQDFEAAILARQERHFEGM